MMIDGLGLFYDENEKEDSLRGTWRDKGFDLTFFQLYLNLRYKPPVMHDMGGKKEIRPAYQPIRRSLLGFVFFFSFMKPDLMCDMLTNLFWFAMLMFSSFFVL